MNIEMNVSNHFAQIAEQINLGNIEALNELDLDSLFEPTKEENRSEIISMWVTPSVAEKVKEYFQQLGEEKAKEFVEGVQSAAAESLEKFFILNKVTELLGLEIDWNSEQEPFFVEKQLYTKLVGELETPADEKKVAKKAPAKKTSKKAE